MTTPEGFSERAQRLHPELTYQVDDPDSLPAEREMVRVRVAGRRTVLEVGCAIGNFSQVLAGEVHDVTAVEGDPRAAAVARERGIRVVEGDAEQPATWAELGTFDAILFMHVLEHLADPWETLRLARDHVAEGGSVISLLPNVAAWRIRRALFFGGRFDYTDRGILDRTHLRFFTRESGAELHRAAGYTRIEQVPVDTRAPFEPLLRHRLGLRRIGWWYGRAMLRRFPNLCTETFLLEARP